MQSRVPSGNETNQVGRNLTCADEFYLDEDGICIPECGRFQVYFSRSAETAASGLILAAATVGIVSGIMVIVISFIRYKCV